MTLKQKIENLTWADLTKKIKSILSDFNIGFESLTGRVSVLESTPAPEAVLQNLQSVLNNGSNAVNSSIIMLDSAFDFFSTRNQEVTIISKNTTKESTWVRPARIETYKGISGSGTGNVIDTENIIFSNKNSNITVKAPSELGDIITNITLNLPYLKPTGVYTLATTDDITKIGTIVPTYTNNAAAVSGGLTVNSMYKTATGELRFVI